jgi:hypothetical protein
VVVRPTLAAAALAVGVGAGAGGAGDWLPKYSASGTITIPRRTVSTKVTAPHSRRMKDQFTERRL